MRTPSMAVELSTGRRTADSRSGFVAKKWIEYQQ